MMSLGLFIFISWMAFMTIMGLGLIYWGWKDGQFHNVEESKYRMLEDREPQPWPGREERKKEHSSRTTDRGGLDG